MTDIYNDIQTEPIPYYLLDTGEIYDRKDKIFVTRETDKDYLDFTNAGGKPLSINDTGYTRTQLIETVLKEYHWEVGDCLLTFEQLKTKKLEELATASAAFEENLNKQMHFKSSLGFTSDGDRRTGQNIKDLIELFDTKSSDGVIPYNDYYNNVQKLTKEQLKILSNEQILNGLNLYEQKKALRDRINKASSKEELEKITVIFEMLDFSKIN